MKAQLGEAITELRRNEIITRISGSYEAIILVILNDEMIKWFLNKFDISKLGVFGMGWSWDRYLGSGLGMESWVPCLFYFNLGGSLNKMSIIGSGQLCPFGGGLGLVL